MVADTQVVKYEVASPDEEQGRTRLAWGLALGTYADRESQVAAQVLAEVLAGDNEAPAVQGGAVPASWPRTWCCSGTTVWPSPGCCWKSAT